MSLYITLDNVHGITGVNSIANLNNNLDISSKSILNSIIKKKQLNLRNEILSWNNMKLTWRSFFFGIIGFRRLGTRLERRKRVRAFDDPTEPEEDSPGEYRGSPGVRVPLAVLPHRELPLLPQRRLIRIHRLWPVWIRHPLTRVARSGSDLPRRFLPRRRRRRRSGVVVIFIGDLVLLRHFAAVVVILQMVKCNLLYL